RKIVSRVAYAIDHTRKVPRIWSDLDGSERPPAVLDRLAQTVLSTCGEHDEPVVERLKGCVLRRKTDRNSTPDVEGGVRRCPVDLVVLIERHANGISGSRRNCVRPRIGAVRGGQDHYLVRVRLEQAPAAADASQVLGLDDSPHGSNVRILIVDVLSAPGDGAGSWRHPDNQGDNSEQHYESRSHTDLFPLSTRFEFSRDFVMPERSSPAPRWDRITALRPEAQVTGTPGREGSLQADRRP